MAKEYLWHGMTEEKVQKLDIQEFSKYIPARARRSLLRGIRDEQKKLLKNCAANDPNIRTQSRDVVIVPAMLGKTIRVHNGKEWLPVMINIDMLGHYLGEFSQTRKFSAHSAAGIGATRSSKAVSAR